MTDDDFRLNSSDADQWHAIVTNEWSSRLARRPMRMCEEAEVADTRSVHAKTPLSIVVYRPRRPSMLPLAMSAMLTGVVMWAVVDYLAPTYRLAALAVATQGHRAEAVHQLTVSAAIIAAPLLLASACCCAWLVAFARYRLRLTSFHHASVGTPTTTRVVRPPNPVTAMSWVLLLLIGSVIAWCRIAPRSAEASSTQPEAGAALDEAVVAGLAWLAVLLLCTGAMTVWASRESRHRLRRSSINDRPVEQVGFTQSVK